MNRYKIEIDLDFLYLELNTNLYGKLLKNLYQKIK